MLAKRGEGDGWDRRGSGVRVDKIVNIILRRKRNF